MGYGDGAMYLASDAFAMAPLTNRLAYLEDGDWVVLTRNSAEIRSADDALVDRKIHVSNVSAALIGKAGHRHFMLKEIFEQPQVIGDTINAFVSASTGTIALPDLPFDPAKVPRLTIVACGTAYYVAMVAKYWFEQVARLPVDVDIGSEFRYRDTPFAEGGVAVFVSQSGETLDTLESAASCQTGGPAHRLDRQRAREHHRSRERPRSLHAGRPGNRRCIHQGLYHPTDGHGLPRAGIRTRSWHDHP